MEKLKKVELLAPAGNLEKLKIAVIYGADAVYIGGEAYGLRASSDNFTLEQMAEGILFAQARGKKVYLTMNIIPHNEDITGMEDYISRLSALKDKDGNQAGLDGIIASDPGVIALIKEIMPHMEIHLSTQANNTNWKSAAFWYQQGIKRIVLARELSLGEIREIYEKAPKGQEFEMFIHGAMCISYSGRCLLSNYMVSRDANKGMCSHPCRWNYKIVEEQRPGEYYPVLEDAKGTYIFNSKDLCMIDHIPEMINSGVHSFKIEGRMKSAFYVATVVNAYRQAINAYYENPENYSVKKEWRDLLSYASHRKYTTGFYLDKPGSCEQEYEDSGYIRNYDYLGIILEYDEQTGYAKIEQKNKFVLGDEIEVVTPYHNKKFIIRNMKNEDLEDISEAPHAKMTVYVKTDEKLDPYTILAKSTH